jgi:2-amino-4-hydroxy-6-hydroxymethyldihydropteridine diphosphokinase
VSYRAAVALGSNLGDRIATLRVAVEQMARLGTVEAVSSLYETAPVGGPDQDPYLNAVLVVDTDLSPGDLLAALQTIENDAGRVRRERWGPRTLDLDIVTMLDPAGAPVVVESDNLTIPHPRAGQRRFMLEPLAEIWPQAPVGDVTAGDALGAVLDQQVELLGRQWTEAAGTTPAILVAVQVVALAIFGVVVVATGSLPDDGWRTVIGAIVALGGIAVGVWGSFRLGAALTPSPNPRPGTRLVESGPYRWIRHPIYLGVCLSLVGTAVFFGSVAALVLALALGVFFWFKAGYEESLLRLGVPGYPAYMRRVRGRLLPRSRPDSE